MTDDDPCRMVPRVDESTNETCVSIVLAEGVRVTRIRIMSTKILTGESEEEEEEEDKPYHF